jgi:hypothetical protein
MATSLSETPVVNWVQERENWTPRKVPLPAKGAPPEGRTAGVDADVDVEGVAGIALVAVDADVAVGVGVAAVPGAAAADVGLAAVAVAPGVVAGPACPPPHAASTRPNAEATRSVIVSSSIVAAG